MGFKTVLKRSSTRYKDDMLEKYFNLDVACEDSDKTNTIYVTNTVPLLPTHFVFNCSENFDDSILSESFMCSGHCNGWDVVNSFNHDKYKNGQNILRISKSI